MKVRVIIAAMKRDGWVQVQQTGSHRKFRHPVKTNQIIIAYAGGKNLPPDQAAAPPPKGGALVHQHSAW